MEVNKEQAEKCRDLGAAALRLGDYARAAKMLQKSLKLYPLPGVEALASHAQSRLNKPTTTTSSNAENATNGTSRGSAMPGAAAPANTGSDGRAYTSDQVGIVTNILKSKEGGRGAHYRVLGISQSASESEIKKAYRKLSLKVHPDKNSAPHADEAFKAVGLAYATLSDTQKRAIYDRYGEEDPDNRGGGGPGMRRRPGAGQEMTPEEIFQAFFGGGMPGGGGPGGVHFYSTGFGPGMQFRAGGQRPRQRRNGQEPNPGLGLLQFLPLLFMLLTFFGGSSDNSRYYSPGENQYFSLTSTQTFMTPLKTSLTKVKDIPYYVSNKFMRTYHRDRYQLSKVESMVEKAYENFLLKECSAQEEYKRQLYKKASLSKTAAEKQRQLKLATEFALARCEELDEFFPHVRKSRR